MAQQATTTPKSDPSYPGTLPDAGSAATEWALDIMHGARKKDAWVTTVIDINAKAEWTGNHYVTEAGALSHRSDAGHYVCVGILKPGSTQRIDDNVEAVTGVVFDDVGVVGQPDTKLDIEWFKDKPEPTFIVETSAGNHQFFFVFDGPIDPNDYRAFVSDLKKTPAAGGIKDGTSLTRYVRLPSGRNPKANKGGFQTRLVAGSGKKHSLADLMAAFGVAPDDSGSEWVPGEDEQVCGNLPPDPTNPAASAAPLGSGVRGNKTPPVIPEALALPQDQALALLDEIEKLIENDRIGREDWIGIVFGFYNASGRNDEVQAIVERFTAKRKDGPVNPADDLKTVWETRGSADKAGLTTLVRCLEDQGTPEATKMVERINQIQAPSKFDAIPGDSGDKFSSGSAAADPDLDAELPVILDWETAKAGRVRTIQPTIFPGLDRGLLTVIAGASGTLKSTYLMHAAIAIITERPDIIGVSKLDFCGDVLVFANEDPEEIIDKRLDAIQARHGVKSRKHKLFVQSGQMFEKTTGRDGGKFVWNADAEARITAIALQVKKAGRQLALIAIDTLASTAAGNDETNREMQEIAGLVDGLIRKVGSAGLFVHHWRKMGTGDKAEVEPGLDAMRGGGAFGNTARNVVFVSKPNKKDRDAAGWTEEMGRDYVKLWVEKRSYGPTTQDDPAWFEKEKVGLPVIDPRDGSLHMEDYLVLMPQSFDKVQQRTAVLRAAWKKIKDANAAGREVVRMPKANKSVRSVQGLLDLPDPDANKILDELVERGWVEVVEGEKNKSNDWKTPWNVVALQIDAEEEDSNI